jgi:F-type H+-transporting ATPase subunit delta
MRHQILVRRYAQGMVQALKEDREYESVLASLKAFLEIYREREDLRTALASPFLNARRRTALLEDVAARAGVRGKALRFLSLLLAYKRLDLFPAIVEILPEAWHEKLGVRTFEVVSAVPLTDAQKGRLGARVEAWQKAPVRLVYTIDPEIVGGLALRRGHVVYDVSVRGQLERFQETLREA